MRVRREEMASWTPHAPARRSESGDKDSTAHSPALSRALNAEQLYALGALGEQAGDRFGDPQAGVGFEIGKPWSCVDLKTPPAAA
jgi:hypothetical protein